MAQIFGYLSLRSDSDAANVAAAMGQRMRRPTQGSAETWSDPKGCGGMGGLLDKEQGSLSSISGPGGEFVVAIDGRIEIGANIVGQPGETLVDRYQRSGAEFVQGLGGSYAIALYDRTAGKLILATDRLSTRALFWLKTPEGIAFSSELKGLLAVGGWMAQLDPQAIASYLRYGRLFGRRTMCRGVELLPPGKTLIYDAARDAIEMRAANGLEATVQKREPLTRDRLQAMGEAFSNGVHKGCPGEAKVGLSLSGGLDSRAILAVLARRRKNAIMRTEGMEGCMDQRVGARLAAATGFPWCFQPLKQFDIHTYVEAMRRYVYLTDGMLVPEGFPGIGPIRFAEQEGLSVLQRGHGGENARVGDAWPFQVKDDVLNLSSRDDLARFVEPGSNGQHGDVVGLFHDAEVERAVAEPEDTLMGYARTIDGTMTPAETMNLLYLRINDGGQVTAFRNCLRGYADMALPYLDDAFLDLVLGTKVSDRRGEAIHNHLIQAHCPELMKVPNSNHGAPLNACRLRRVATEKAHALFRKLRLPGFRHYHYVDTWMQKLLRESVSAFLLDPRSLGRGLIHAEKLKQIVNDPSQPGRPRLLVRLVAIEMWARLFADREIDGYQLSLSA